MTETSPWLRRYTKLVAASTLFLIYAGAMVTSTGSGLAVPDWPLSYGRLMPPMVAGIFYEHGHRMIAATVGLLTVIQAIWLQRREPRRFVRVLGWVAVGAVIVQGIFGGLTVIFLLPKLISIAHAGLAQIFFCLTVSIAFFTSRWRAAASGGPGPLRGAALHGLTKLLVFVVYVQILLGALVRHLGAGLAIPDFPLSFGRLIPDFTTVAIAANYAHRVGALVVTIVILTIAAKIFRGGPRQLRPLAALLLVVLAGQIALGALVVFDGAENLSNYHSLAGEAAIHHASITSFHVMTGAFTLALSLLLALSARTLSRPAAAPAPLRAAEVPA